MTRLGGHMRDQTTDEIDDEPAPADNKQYDQFVLAVKMAADYERIGDLVDRISDRNIYCGASNEWDTTQILDEHVGEPLCFTWHGTTDSNPAWGDAEWTVTHVDVLTGTGGPANGIEFRDYDDARVWHQDWFTARSYAPLDSTTAQVLANYFGLEF